jgi:hypothetical protein
MSLSTIASGRADRSRANRPHRYSVALAAGCPPISPTALATRLPKQQDPTTSAENLVLTVRLRSSVDTEQLEHILQRFLDRYTAPRSVRQLARSLTTDHVDWARGVRLTCVDATYWNDSQMNEVARLTSLQSIDPAEAAVRAVLFTRADDDHLLLLTVHHSAVSAWQRS